MSIPLRNSNARSPIRQMDLTRRTSLKTPEKSPRTNHEKVQVVIRIRPPLKYQDRQHLVEVEDDNTLAIVRPGYDNMYMKFNHIVPGGASQLSVFGLVIESINSFLKGINNTIFAYGQTGAGKTYTVTGDCPENIGSVDSATIKHKLLNESTRGILPRALEMIFAEVKKRKQPDPRITLSFFEIYNEKIFDLYNLASGPLQVRESKSGEVSIPELTTVEVDDLDQAYTLLAQGLKNRVTKATHVNSKSSRSHSIFQLTYQRTGKMKLGDRINEFRVTSSVRERLRKIRIVDLAGSQKFKIPTGLSQAEQELRIQQVTCINGSLSSLGHCISALIEKARTHIPFRNSKLTRILSDSLMGNGKLKLIICISPSVSAAAETFSTLQFANRAKKAIIERPQTPKPSADRSRVVDIEEFNSLMRQYEKQKKARIQLEGLQATSDKWELIEKNQQLERENQQLRAQLKILTNSQLNGIHTPKSTVSPRRLHTTNQLGQTGNFGRKTYQPPRIEIDKPSRSIKGHQLDSKSFLSLSVLKQDRKAHTQQQIPTPSALKKETQGRLLVNKLQMHHQSSLVSNKRKIFENKYKKFLDFKSPEKREASLEEGRKSTNNSAVTPFNEQIRSQLDKIRKAIKSKEEWFELDNQSDQLNDTREVFVNQTDDEDLFKSQHEGGGSVEDNFGRSGHFIGDIEDEQSLN